MSGSAQCLCRCGLRLNALNPYRGIGRGHAGDEDECTSLLAKESHHDRHRKRAVHASGREHDLSLGGLTHWADRTQSAHAQLLHSHRSKLLANLVICSCLIGPNERWRRAIIRVRTGWCVDEDVGLRDWVKCHPCGGRLRDSECVYRVEGQGEIEVHATHQAIGLFLCGRSGHHHRCSPLRTKRSRYEHTRGLLTDNALSPRGARSRRLKVGHIRGDERWVIGHGGWRFDDCEEDRACGNDVDDIALCEQYLGRQRHEHTRALDMRGAPLRHGFCAQIALRCARGVLAICVVGRARLNG